jgi:signal transduction histidine kinase
LLKAKQSAQLSTTKVSRNTNKTAAMDDQKHFHLVRYFAFVTAPLIFTCIIVAALTYRATMLADLKKMGELANATLGQTLSNTYARQLKSIQKFSLNGKAKTNPPNWIIDDLLNRPIKDFLKNTPVVRVKIFTTSGQAIFSTNSAQINTFDSLEQHAISSAKKGELFSEMEMHPDFIKNDGATESLMIVNTYVPISNNNKVIGVLELYNDISAAYKEVQNGLQVFIAVLFVLGLLFFYTVIFFVQKADRIIEARREIEKRDHEYLSIAFEKAKESTKVKSEFLARMSHELRTPLNAIIGYSEILMEENQENKANPETQNDLNHIRSAGVHLKTLFEEILDHAKVESGVIDIQTSNCNLRMIIDSCIKYISPELEKNKNTISTSLDEAMHNINTDETKIRRILMNLISNANKFTKQGKITINGEVRNGDIVLHVKDTGIGIPENQFQIIFEPFTQVDNSFTREHGGTGLGLTISQEYASALGGKISVVNHDGAGTIMEVRLPYCKAQKKEDSVAKANNSPAA